MKDKLKTVMRACNPNSTQATASMVKIQNKKLVAYGGTFCLQIPTEISVECAFKPQTLLNFYRKDRTGAAFTVKDGKLKVRQGKETVTMQCLPPESMGIIDVFKEMTPTKWIPTPALKALVSCVDTSHSLMALQGVCIRDGEALATNSRVLVAVPVLLGAAHFVIPSDTINFLISCDDAVTHYAFDDHCLKFQMESGMTLCTRVIDPTGFPNVDPVLDQGVKEVVFHKSIKDELKSLKCDSVEISQKGIRYQIDGDGVGTISLETEGDYCFVVSKNLLDVIMSINIGTTFFTTETDGILIGNGKGKFRSACALMINNPFKQ